MSMMSGGGGDAVWQKAMAAKDQEIERLRALAVEAYKAGWRYAAGHHVPEEGDMVDEFAEAFVSERMPSGGDNG